MICKFFNILYFDNHITPIQIEFDELDNLANSVCKEFVLKHSEEYEPNNNYGEFAKESQVLLEQYTEFLKETKLNENQLFK